MEKIRLKDGTSAVLDIWGFDEIRDFVNSGKIIRDNFGHYFVEGFHYINRETIYDLNALRKLVIRKQITSQKWKSRISWDLKTRIIRELLLSLLMMN